MSKEDLHRDGIEKFCAILPRCWSLSSSTLWTADNPAAGHCGVTALVANDVFGGEICKTRFGDIWHFYNIIDGQRYDFTESQFLEPLTYSDTHSDRDEAFGDTNADQYRHLKNAVSSELDIQIEGQFSHHATCDQDLLNVPEPAFPDE